MATLFQRDYVVRVAQLQITDLDVSWDIVKSVKKDEYNSCTLRIYNLNASSRGQIEALSLKPKKDGLQTGNIRVEIEAGYKTTSRALLFRGDLRTAVSSRQGPE